MSHILGIGIAVLDIIYTVADYPAEDDEIRALNQRQSLGGNAVNTLAVLSQLGHQCSWAGVYASDQGAQFIHDQLASFAIDSGWSRRQATGKTPTSYIILNSRNGSRTIVHYRDLTEYAFTDFDKINLPGFDCQFAVCLRGSNPGRVDEIVTEEVPAEGAQVKLQAQGRGAQQQDQGGVPAQRVRHAPVLSSKAFAWRGFRGAGTRHESIFKR